MKKTIKPMPNPTTTEMNDQLFDAIFHIIKDWDICIPEYYSGYMSGNGSHAKLIMDALRPALRDAQLNKLNI